MRYPRVDKLTVREDVKGLIKALGYPAYFKVRAAAADALGHLGDPRAVEPLVATLGDDDMHVREAAAGALGHLGDPRAVDSLAAILCDTDVLDAAFSALVTIGAPCVPALVATLKDDKFSVRTDAAKALGQIGDARAVEPLIATLRDSKEPVREAAAEALDRLGWSPDSGEAEAAYWVAKARWDKCVGDAAVGPLIAVLDDEKVSKSASEVLVRIGAGAVEPLIASLDSTAGAGAVLARIGAPAVEPLIATLQCDGTLSEAAAEALGQIGDVRAVEPLVTALKD